MPRCSRSSMRPRPGYQSLAGADERLEELRAEVEALGPAVTTLAEQVTAGRMGARTALADALGEEIQDLGMPGAAIQVALGSLPEPGPSGAERVELRFRGGPGQPWLTFAKAASGGELSRVMLACRSVLADLDDVPTLVFDEVDAGIGGQAGLAVGRRLARLAMTRQVVVVTHLPQIALLRRPARPRPEGRGGGAARRARRSGAHP